MLELKRGVSRFSFPNFFFFLVKFKAYAGRTGGILRERSDYNGLGALHFEAHLRVTIVMEGWTVLPLQPTLS
jgi:hypothetical protein